jgi:hypothetical protein
MNASRPNDATEALLRDMQEELAALLQAVATDDPQLDIKLAEMLDGEPELVRIAILEKLQEMLAAREDEKKREIEKAAAATREQAREQAKVSFRHWLMWMMSESSLRKMRESFMALPGMERAVRNIGAELAKKGVLTNIQPADKRDLGALSASIQQNYEKQRERDAGRGGR